MTVDLLSRKLAVMASTNAANAVTMATTAILLNAMGVSDVSFEDFEIKGMVLIANAVRVAMRRVKVTGALSQATQYSETGINVAGYFGTSGQTYASDSATINGSDFGHAIAGSVLTTTMTGGTLGYTRQARYVLSDFIPLTAANRYVIDIASGFLGGAGAASPQILLYDANKAAVSSGQGNNPANLFIPNDDTQNGTITAIITGAAYIRIALGSYRDYPTAVGLAATFDLSKITILRVINDLGALAVTASPGDAAQVQVSTSRDVTVDDCDFNMVNRSCVKLIRCTSCTVSRNRIRTCLQGVTDDSGVNNRVIDNDMDLRLSTTGGVQVGSKAFRLRGIGGTGSQGGDYSRNRIRGASWAIELIPNDITFRNTANDNIIEAEFAGLSLTTGDWFTANNRITLGPMGRFGIEMPGISAGVLNNVTALGNVIRWCDFSGYLGFGISATNVNRVFIKGGTIRAPILVQNAGSNSGGEVVIEGVSGDYGVSAVLGRDCSILAHFKRLRPYILCFPYGTGAGSGVFDIQLYSAMYSFSVSADHLVPGASCVAQVANSSNISISLPEVRPTNYVTDQYIKISWPAGWATNIQLTRCNFIGVPSSMGSSQWCSLGSATPANGSLVMMADNVWAGRRAPVPTGSYARTLVNGDPRLNGYNASMAVGTIAAGASWTGTISTFGACTTDGLYDVVPVTPGALAGLIAQGWGSADDMVTVQITNPSATAKAVGTIAVNASGRRQG